MKPAKEKALCSRRWRPADAPREEKRTGEATTVPAFFEGWKKGSLIAQRYKILDQIAEVRMGPIYTALDSAGGGVCALKLITPWNIPTADLINQLSEYYQRMQRFQHPHMVRTLDLGQAEDGVLFLVTEYVRGANLRQIIEQETPWVFPAPAASFGKSPSRSTPASSWG